MLLAFGIYTFRSNPVKSLRPSSGTRGTYLHNFVTAFFVTLSNPLIIFLFIGLFARFSFVMPGSPIGFQLVGYLAIILGALGWWFSITYFVNKVRSRFNLRGIWVLNRIIGVVVMIAAVVGIVLAIAANLFLDRICIFLNNLKKEYRRIPAVYVAGGRLDSCQRLRHGTHPQEISSSLIRLPTSRRRNWPAGMKT